MWTKSQGPIIPLRRVFLRTLSKYCPYLPVCLYSNRSMFGRMVEESKKKPHHPIVPSLKKCTSHLRKGLIVSDKYLGKCDSHWYLWLIFGICVCHRMQRSALRARTDLVQNRLPVLRDNLVKNNGGTKGSVGGYVFPIFEGPLMESHRNHQRLS